MRHPVYPTLLMLAILSCMACQEPIQNTASASSRLDRFLQEGPNQWRKEEVLVTERKYTSSGIKGQAARPCVKSVCSPNEGSKIQPELGQLLGQWHLLGPTSFHGDVAMVNVVAVLRPDGAELEPPADRLEVLRAGRRRVDRFLQILALSASNAYSDPDLGPSSASTQLYETLDACTAYPAVLLAATPEGIEELRQRDDVLYLELEDVPAPRPKLVAGLSTNERHPAKVWQLIGGPWLPTADVLTVALLDNGAVPHLASSSGRDSRFYDCTCRCKTGCCDENTPGCDVTDGYELHGSLAWTILDTLLPQGHSLVSYNVFDGPNINVFAYCKAVEHSIAHEMDLIVAEVAEGYDERSIIGRSSERAVLAGLPVLAAAGNRGDSGACCVGIPARLPTVLGVGAWDLFDSATDTEQSRGPADDGRVKPDLQAPTNTTVDFDGKYYVFGDTSGALPYLGGFAGRLSAWLKAHVAPDDLPSALWPLLVALGDNLPDFSSDRGVGLAALPAQPRSVWTGKASISPGQEVMIPLSSSRGTVVRAAIWWRQPGGGSPRVDLDLCLANATGGDTCSSSQPNVFEADCLAEPVSASIRWEGPAAGPAVEVHFGAYEMEPGAASECRLRAVAIAGGTQAATGR